MKSIVEYPWLNPAEQEEAVGLLLKYDLVKWGSGLTTKTERPTDIYINLRKARDNPDAVKTVSGLFAKPLRRLAPEKFVGVPRGMNPFLDEITQKTGISHVPVREMRTFDAKPILYIQGGAPYGGRVCLVDDVISDGGSKMELFFGCHCAGIKPQALVVLVDRQQGWRKTFAEKRINLPVWAGMTLHDVRYHLISTFRVMDRCDPSCEERNRVIVALDGKEWDEVLPIVTELRETGCILKVGDLLFEKDAGWLLPQLGIYGRIMVDLKWHDIPNTLKNLSRRFLNHPPWAITVHASGGEDMIRAAVKMFKGTPTKILAVTLLTSLDAGSSHEIYRRTPDAQVMTLARIANRAGAHGFVCSSRDIPMLRQLFPGKTVVATAIRTESISDDDQQRTGTPAGAIDKGADFVVLGRDVFSSSDPIARIKQTIQQTNPY